MPQRYCLYFPASALQFFSACTRAPLIPSLRCAKLGVASADTASVTASAVRSVLILCASDTDLRTLGAWARATGMSCTTLRELSYLARVSPRAARDLGRVLRVVLKSQNGWHPELLLDIADRRTLARLTSKAGLKALGRRTRQELIAGLFESQSFVDPSNTAVRLLHETVQRTLQG